MQAKSFTESSIRSKFLIEADELASMIDAKEPTLRIMNATWFMPNDPRNAKDMHQSGRITPDT